MAFEPNRKCQHSAKGCLHPNADIGAAVQSEGWLASGVNAKQTRGRLIVGLDDPPAGPDDDGGVGVVGLAMGGGFFWWEFDMASYGGLQGVEA